MQCIVFISYSRVDIAVAERLELALSSAGLSTWRDEKGIRPGDSFPDDIAAAIDSCFAVVWLASAASCQSAWVRRELAYSTDAKKLIVPIHLNRETLDQIPPGLRLLFSHIDYVNLHEGQDWDIGVAAVIQSLRAAGALAGFLPLSERRPAGGSVPPPHPLVGTWPDQNEAVETPIGLDLLPIDENSPLVLGVAVDASGSMQTATQNDAGGQRNRLEWVLDSIREPTRSYRAEGNPAPPVPVNPQPQEPVPAPPSNLLPSVSIGLPVSQHNVPVPSPTGPAPGMVINVPGQINNAAGHLLQIVVKFNYLNGPPLSANPQEASFRDIGGLVATGSRPRTVGSNSEVLGTEPISIPYYALNFVPTNGIRQYQLSFTACVFLDNQIIAQSQVFPFTLRW